MRWVSRREGWPNGPRKRRDARPGREGPGRAFDHEGLKDSAFGRGLSGAVSTAAGSPISTRTALATLALSTRTTLATLTLATLRTTLFNSGLDTLFELSRLGGCFLFSDSAGFDCCGDALGLLTDEKVNDLGGLDTLGLSDVSEGAATLKLLPQCFGIKAEQRGNLVTVRLASFLVSCPACCFVGRVVVGGGLGRGRCVIDLGICDTTDLGDAEDGSSGDSCGQKAGADALVHCVDLLVGGPGIGRSGPGEPSGSCLMNVMKRCDGQHKGWESTRLVKDPQRPESGREGCGSLRRRFRSARTSNSPVCPARNPTSGDAIIQPLSGIGVSMIRMVTGGASQECANRRVSRHRGRVQKVDIAIIGGGPAGAAAAIRAARRGAKVVLFEKGPHGRDKVCGDGLTPRAVGALNELEIDMADAHRIRGLRMIAGKTMRELDWPTTDRFPNHGAVWPRRRLDAALIDAAAEAGADIRFETEAFPILDGQRVIGVEARATSDDRTPTGPSEKFAADLTIVAAGPPGQVARMLGANRVEGETFGLAIRTYAESPRHGSEHLEAMLSLKDENGTAVPGYGWMFPAGDGTVNIGVGALSTMKGFKKLNLNKMIASYRNVVGPDWELGPNLERPRAWRLPMSTQKRFGPGWVAIGDAAGLVNPMNGEGIDYGLESGMLAADLFIDHPATANSRYDQEVGERFDAFLRTGRRFSFLIGHPWILKPGLKFSVSTKSIANITLAVMGNLVDNSTPGVAGKVMWAADKGLGLADPILRKTRASASA